MEEIKKMKFSVLTEKGHAEVRERNLPEMGPDDVLVKQLACNICTTDYGQWLGLRSIMVILWPEVMRSPELSWP